MGDPLPLGAVVVGEPLLLTPEEAAEVLRVGRTTIYALMKADEVRPVHIGRSCRISRAELERYVRRLETPRPSAAPHPVGAGKRPRTKAASSISPPSLWIAAELCKPALRRRRKQPDSTPVHHERPRERVMADHLDEREEPPSRQSRADKSKRASGESSIYRDEDGRWHGFVSMGQKENSRRDRRHVSGSRRADVVAKVRAIEAKRDAGIVEAAGKAPTVGEWLDHWLDNIAARKVRARTLESYRSIVRLHLRPGLGHHRLDRLQPEHLERLYASLVEKGLSPATTLRVHRVLSRALRVAFQRGKVARNVATLVDPPVVRRPETALPLSVTEARAVITAAQAHRNAARWTVALAVGLRQSETLGLKWADVDLELGTLSVRRGLHRVAGQGLVYEEPKADRSRRTLALPAPLVEALRTHRAAQLEERSAAGSLWQDHHDLVFAQANGRPIERKSDWHAWKTILREAGVREVRLHDGRHTAATLLLSEGVHPRVVMEVLGHAQMRTTTDTYSHVMPALGRDAADRMGRALWDSPAP